MSLIAPPNLQRGDTVYLCAPAKAIEENYVLAAELWLQAMGLVAIRSEHLLNQHHYFSGTTMERLTDFQVGLDHPVAKAIWCVRGGYGSIQILDGLQWAGFLRDPKWIIGFSDICVIHHKIQALGYQSVHGTMALNLEKNSAAAKHRLIEVLNGTNNSFEIERHSANKLGEAEGILVGGNLSILYSMLAAPECYQFEGSILFIEDLAEHLYHIDRMLFALNKTGALNKILGLIVGGMTDLEDTDTPFGLELEEIILSHFKYRSIPICFGFPAGHIDDNQALLLGAKIRLEVNETNCRVNYL